MFANSDASCGPSNPLQNFGKHVNENSAGQRERFTTTRQPQGFRTPQDQHAREQLNNEFQAFNQAGSSSQVFHPPPLNQPLYHAGQQQQQQRNRSAQGDWANEFSNLSIGTPTFASPSPIQHQTPPSHIYQPQPYHAYPQQSLTPNFTSQFATSPALAQQTEHKQAHHLNAHSEAEMRAFEDAFDQVQRSLAVESVESKTEQVRDEVSIAEAKDGEDLSKVAQTIVNAVNHTDRMSPHIAEKLKNSQFMNLMKQLSDKSVKLDGEKFVDQSGNDVGTQESAKRHENETVTNHDYIVEETEHQIPDHSAAVNQPDQLHTPNLDLEPPKEPPEIKLFPGVPDSYILQEKEGVMSSFLAAQQLGPNGLAQSSNWEENYDEWM